VIPFAEKQVSGPCAGRLVRGGALPAPEATAQSVEEQRKAYEQQAQEKQKKSQELEGRIQNVSEEKRQLDEEATKAIEEHKKLKAALDETTSRMKETQSRLDTLEKDYTQKRDKLGKRVRDIYMHGQISYIDVLFGAKDFQDLLTRMDLLKRIIKDDYTLVHTVMDERDEMTARKEQPRAGPRP
jgi:peptidoglycan hydrolase CwlO-like protein